MKKAPDAVVAKSGIEDYHTPECFDYIFNSSGSVSLFTDGAAKMKVLLKKGGEFVFAVDTVVDRCPDSKEYKTDFSVKAKKIISWF